MRLIFKVKIHFVPGKWNKYLNSKIQFKFIIFSVYNLCTVVFIHTLDSFIPMGDGDDVYKDGVMFCREREKEKRNLNKKKE